MTRHFSDADKHWGRLNAASLEHVKNGDWGLYANAELDKSTFLAREGRPEQAIETLFWVIYLDMNGPENMGGIPPDMLEEMISQYPPFNPELGVIPPALVERVAKIADSLAWDTNKIKSKFLSAISIRRIAIMPLSPDDAWERLAVFFN